MVPQFLRTPLNRALCAPRHPSRGRKPTACPATSKKAQYPGIPAVQQVSRAPAPARPHKTLHATEETSPPIKGCRKWGCPHSRRPPTPRCFAFGIHSLALVCTLPVAWVPSPAHLGAQQRKGCPGTHFRRLGGLEALHTTHYLRPMPFTGTPLTGVRRCGASSPAVPAGIVCLNWCSISLSLASSLRKARVGVGLDRHFV
jgi:hypothetical protein